MSVAVKASVLVSTSSPHVLSGEPIPREYHRKVLKKIAQLTKVTVLLNYSFQMAFSVDVMLFPLSGRAQFAHKK